jgi:hypothetical protein
MELNNNNAIGGSMTIKSKHNNLLNYFIFDKKDLSKAYLKSCNEFFNRDKPEIAYKKAVNNLKRKLK